MGASAQPSASGVPPKTRGCRARARLADVEDGAGSDTGTPGHNGEETSLGEGGPETLGGGQAGIRSPGPDRRGVGTKGPGTEGEGSAGRAARTSAAADAPPVADSRKAAAAARSAPLGSAV